MKRSAYLITGLAALLLGALGMVLPILPTVPFMLLAVYCFGRSSPALEQKLVRHPKIGPPIVAWRTHGAIGRTGKRAAYASFALSALVGIMLLQGLASLLPAMAAAIGAGWVFSRPTT